MSQEEVKCQQNVNLCNKLLFYGKCDKFSCQFCHILSDQEKFKRPTSFIVKIREHFDNNKWASRDETNKLIQQRLNEMQTFCQQKESPLMMKEAVDGGVYAKFEEKSGVWVRVMMIELM